MASKDTLQKRVEQLKEQADRVDGSVLPRGVFLREGQSVEDAVREARLEPGTKFLPFRFRTEQEQHEAELLVASEKQFSKMVEKNDEDKSDGTNTVTENPSGHSRVPGPGVAEDDAGRD